MKTYFIAQIKITDQAVYNKYLEHVDEVFSKFNGKYIVLDNSPEVIENEWDYTRMVVIEFGSKDEFTKWYYSADYQRILEFRLAGAVCNSVIVNSLE